MVLAAGRGVRMRPLTDTQPKPLISVGGRTMLDRVLDALARTTVDVAVVNLHHLGEMIAAHLAGRTSPRIVLSRESTLLETGGGIVAALPHLGASPFYVINGDVVWTEGPVPALARLAQAFDPARMDGILLLAQRETAVGFDGAGDFFIESDGRIVRRGARATAPYVFAGLQILTPSLFEGAPSGAFSLNRLYDRAAADGRLFGLVHDGAWLHVGTPKGLIEAEAALARLEGRV
jgi:MurNAc alpha-1-phosphate uridylyltransferase